MTDQALIPVFDGHNDVLLRLKLSGHQSPEKLFLEGENVGHIDLPKARKGGLAGGLCAIYVPSPRGTDANGDFLAPTQQTALSATLGMASLPENRSTGTGTEQNAPRRFLAALQNGIVSISSEFSYEAHGLTCKL